VCPRRSCIAFIEGEVDYLVPPALVTEHSNPGPRGFFGDCEWRKGTEIKYQGRLVLLSSCEGGKYEEEEGRCRKGLSTSRLAIFSSRYCNTWKIPGRDTLTALAPSLDVFPHSPPSITPAPTFRPPVVFYSTTALAFILSTDLNLEPIPAPNLHNGPHCCPHWRTIDNGLISQFFMVILSIAKSSVTYRRWHLSGVRPSQ
jgi:hypothetical protein